MSTCDHSAETRAYALNLAKLNFGTGQLLIGGSGRPIHAEHDLAEFAREMAPELVPIDDCAACALAALAVGLRRLVQSGGLNSFLG